MLLTDRCCRLTWSLGHRLQRECHDELHAPRRLFVLAAAFMFCLSSSISRSEDWPQWRGVNRDGVVATDVPLIETLPAGHLPLTWSVPLGPGYSGPTVVGDRVYVMDRQVGDEDDSRERVLCFDAETGDIVWQHDYQVRPTRSSTQLDHGPP